MPDHMSRYVADARKMGSKTVDALLKEREELVDKIRSLQQRGAGKRLSKERKSAESGEMNDAQNELLEAVQDWQKRYKRRFPTWTEILDIFKGLGYRKCNCGESIGEEYEISSSDSGDTSDQVRSGCSD